MHPKQAVLARRSMDRRLATLRSGALAEGALDRPGGGWLRAIREALGMSAEQLGQRLGRTRQAVVALERSELDGGIRLSSLQRAAEAMGCELVYAVVPRASLDEAVEHQAQLVAAAEIEGVQRSMELEAQGVDLREVASQISERARELSGSRRLWDQLP